MSIKRKILIIGFIFLLCAIIVIIIFPKKNYISSFENELLRKENNGGTIIINLDKDTNKSDYCIYLKDLEYNNTVNFSKKPIQLITFSINTSSKLQVNKKENWTREKFGEFYKKINSLEKYEQDNGNYIKIRDYKSDYYVNMLSLNPIIYEYFFINLNVPTENLLK